MNFKDPEKKTVGNPNMETLNIQIRKKMYNHWYDNIGPPLALQAVQLGADSVAGHVLGMKHLTVSHREFKVFFCFG